MSQDLATLSSSVSHLLSADAAVAVAGYSLEREFGGIRILRRDAGGPPVRQWQEYTPTPVHESEIRVMGRVDANAPTLRAERGNPLRRAVTAGWPRRCAHRGAESRMAHRASRKVNASSGAQSTAAHARSRTPAKRVRC